MNSAYYRYFVLGICKSFSVADSTAVCNEYKDYRNISISRYARKYEWIIPLNFEVKILEMLSSLCKVKRLNNKSANVCSHIVILLKPHLGACPRCRHTWTAGVLFIINLTWNLKSRRLFLGTAKSRYLPDGEILCYLIDVTTLCFQ
jgi:hypothetical protein